MDRALSFSQMLDAKSLRSRELAAGIAGVIMFRYSWMIAGLLLTVAPGAFAQAPAWVSGEAGEAPDPAIRYGELPNGFRFAMMHSAEPKGVVVINYRIAVGTAEEGVQEKEYAHLVEHLAFGQTTAFPKGDAISQLQAAGMQLGNDVNGFTTPRGTVYALTVPQVSSARLSLALRFLRGVSDGELFEANEVERQIGVVTAEIAGGENQAARASRSLRQQLFPELPYLWGLPADRIASVRAASADRLRAFHDRLYRPDAGFLVIVGDVDPADTIKAIEAAFSTWKRPVARPSASTTPKFQPRVQTASVIQEAGLSDVVTFAVAKANPDPIPTSQDRREGSLAILGMAIVRDRIERQLLSDPQVPIATVSDTASRWPGLAEFYSFTGSLRPGKWREALTLLDQETRRPLETGFTMPEVDRLVLSTLKSARSASLRATSRTSSELARGIVAAYTDHIAFVLPERNFQRLAEILNAATPTDVQRAYRSAWGGTSPSIGLTGSEGLPGSAAVVGAAYRLAHSSSLPPRDLAIPVAKEVPLPGPAGTVAERRHVDDLGLDLVRFANGVRLNVKHTDYRTGEVLTTVRIGGGQLAFPRGQRPVAPPISMLYLGGASGLSAEQIVDGLRGSQVSADHIGLGSDVIQFSGQNNPASLSGQLRLWSALIGAPAFNTGADGLVRARMTAAMEKADATAPAAFSRRWPVYAHGGDKRFAPLDPVDASQLSMAQARSLYGPLLKDAPTEVTVVGDVDVDKTITAVGETLGALPPRRGEPVHSSGPEPAFPAGGDPVVWTHRGEPTRALVASVWRARDGFDPKNDPVQSMLAAILQNRLYNELRQTAGATYSPALLNEASTAIHGYGYIGAVVDVAVADVPLAERTLRTIGTSLAELGPTEEEFARVTAPIISRAALSQRTNIWWSNALDWAQTWPDAQNRARFYEARLKAVRIEDVKALAAGVFITPAVKIRVVPESGIKP